jgi:dihydroorotase
MSSRLVIKNGRVMDPATGFDTIADVAIEGDVIREIAAGIDATGAEVIDATGLIVAPGFIDMHVHFREPGGEHSETIETGSNAAAAGGFTTVCCMPNTTPVNDSGMVTNYILEKARALNSVNVYPIGAITKGSLGEELASIGSMKQAGIVAISDDGKPVMNARVMRRAMEYAKAFHIPVIQHCEDLHLSQGGDMHEGMQSVRLGLRGIPACSEDVMVARDILLTEVTGARYHVAHLSAKNSVAMVAYAKSKGLPVTCEVTPHHLALADSDVVPYDSNYKMKPPLRGNEHVDACIAGIVSGTIDALATDHAPHSGADKMQEFERCPFGILGLETAIPISLERLVYPGKISLMKMIALYTTGPAGILRLPRGRLHAGAPADVTVFSVTGKWTYDVNKSKSKSRNSPFHGTEYVGGQAMSIVAGRVLASAFV